MAVVEEDSRPVELTPETVLVNGRIITVGASDRVADAVAIKDGKIIFGAHPQSVERGQSVLTHPTEDL